MARGGMLILRRLGGMCWFVLLGRREFVRPMQTCYVVMESTFYASYLDVFVAMEYSK
jgi:hypothetical protein